ncbi:MAG: SEL1-like repeat protein [Rhizobiaceae bacterium]|nr:peptidoglycan-binding protein [Hyphomicrobiales bacterium]NRB30346.1 SEL1-like repeat protein [Rhizobiaceae bacterium]
MRPAYSSTAGYHSHGEPFGSGQSGYDQGGDRLTNIRRSIDAIEQRLMNAAAPVAGYGQPSMMAQPMPHQTPNYSAMPQGMHQPMPQGMPQTMAYGQMNQAPGAPAYAPAPQPMPFAANAAAEIAQRQQMLNANTANQAAQQAAQQQASANMSGLGRQLEELKKEIAGVKTQVAKPIAVQQSVPQQEIDRIAKAITELQAQEDTSEAGFDRLTNELDQLRAAMKGEMQSTLQKGIKASGDSHNQALAKQLSALGKDVRAAIRAEVNGNSEQRAKELTGRIDELSRGIDQLSVQSANAVAPRVESLSAQLDSLRMTIDDLPQTLAISRIEDRLGDLTDRISGLAKSQAEAASKAKEDADSSAPIVAAAPTPHVTSEEFVSIEKRLDEIARALVAVSNSGRKAPEVDMSAVERVEARMTELARTLDTVAEQGSNNDTAHLEKLAVRIEGLTERLGSFEKYAENGDLGGASALFASPDTGVIEDQLRALTGRLEEMAAQPGTQTLEQQIQQLSQQVEAASNANSTNAQMTNLESQIGQILQQLDGIDGGGVDFAPVEARLGQIEHQLQANQNFSLEAAQQAAQHAVAMMGPQSEAGGMVNALAHDLKSLQLIAEGNAAQNQQSVSEIQQVLQQVVDRLGTIEGSLEGEAVRQAKVMPEADQGAALAMPAAPNLPDTEPVGDPADSDGLVNAAIADESLGVIHQAAVDAGFVDTESNANASSASSSMPSAAENMPLEPGSAAPNLDEMVQRASAQLNETHAKLSAAAGGEQAPVAGLGDMAVDPAAMDTKDGDERAAGDLRPDAVAAARRALQATSAEMTAVRNEAGGEDDSSETRSATSKLLSSFTSFDTSKLRRPLVLGAAALLLAIVTFKGIGMFTGSNDKPVAKLDAPAVEMNVGENGANGSDTLTAADRVDPNRVVRTVDTSKAPEVIVPAADVVEPVETVKATPQKPIQIEPVAKPVNVPVPTNDPIVEAPAAAAPTPVEETAPVVENAEPEPPKAIYDVSAKAGPAALVAAASAGDPKALFQLGMRYSDGENVQRNMTESATWFLRSAEAGFAPAQYSIGSLYEKGIGVERDVTKATGWYEKAAVQGNARAMHNLAVIYAMGNPPAVQPNMDTAVEWFQRAAKLGIKDSQFNLGILYGQGMGVPQNLIESYKWFALAAKTGDSDASKKRDEVANAMDPDDLDFARGEVNNWAPSKLKESVNRVAVPEEWRGPSASQKSAAKPAQDSVSIMKAQDMLNQRGFNVGEPDGLIGPKTKRAIMEFQKSAGIPITGKVDKKLLEALDLQT